MQTKQKWWNMDALPGEHARTQALRWLLYSYMGLALFGIVMHTAYRFHQQIPLDWYYQSLTAGIGMAAILALYQLRRSLPKAMLTFSGFSFIYITGLLITQLEHEQGYLTVLIMCHVAVFSIGLILGFRVALGYATLVAIMWSTLGLIYGIHAGEVVLPITLAYAATLPANVVEQLIHESTAELARINAQLAAENAERRLTEAALRASESRYRTLVETSPNSIVVCDLQGQIILCNPQTVKLHQFGSPQALIGKNVLDFIAPEDQKRAMVNWQKTSDTGMVQNVEYRLLKDDGTYFPAEMSAALIKNRAGSPEAFIGVIHDISERKQAEEAIRRRNKELTTLNAIASIGSQSRDLGQLLHLILKEVLKVTNIPAGWIQLLEPHSSPAQFEIITQQGFEHDEIHEEMPPDLLTHLAEKVAEKNCPVLIENIAQVAYTPVHNTDFDTGAGHAIAIVGLPIVIRDQVQGILGICNFQLKSITSQDIQLLVTIGHQIGVIVENIRLDKIATEVEILRNVDRLRSELIANVSHEFRTPLGLIKIFCTTLLRDDVTFDRQTQLDFLHDIEEQTNKLEELVTNVLELGSVESGHLRLDKEFAALDQIAMSVLEFMTLRASEHHFSSKFAPEPLLAYVDAQRMEDVFRNLLDNAIKYSPDGGTITVKGYNHGAEVMIQVSDEGVGIPKEEQEKIFERFYRVPNEHTQNAGGTGLGLAVCQGIIQAHGGQIWVESAVDQGSTFYITLPNQNGQKQPE